MINCTIYLNVIGAGVGLDVTPERFVDPNIREQLDCVTNIPGLYMTGQDTSVIGVTLAQVLNMLEYNVLFIRCNMMSFSIIKYKLFFIFYILYL